MNTYKIVFQYSGVYYFVLYIQDHSVMSLFSQIATNSYSWDGETLERKPHVILLDFHSLKLWEGSCVMTQSIQEQSVDQD
jgi:hypothetical protein